MDTDNSNETDNDKSKVAGSEMTVFERRQYDLKKREFEAKHKLDEERIDLERKRLELEKRPGMNWNTAGGVAVIGGLLTISSAVATNYFEGKRNSDIEEKKFQTELIRKSIERAEDNRESAINLNFLWETGLIPDYPGINKFVQETNLLKEGEKRELPSGKTFSQVRVPPATESKIDRIVKIGSWNIKQLGSGQGLNQSANRAKLVADYILLSGVDVLAIQELYINDENTRSNIHLDEALGLLNQVPGNSWEYTIFPNRNSADKSQLVGIAWNSKRVSADSEPFKIPVRHNVNNTGVWDRAPHAMKFNTGVGTTDFVVINLHMKSNYSLRNSSVLDPETRRKTESTELVNNLGNVREILSDEDIILIGDMNTLNHEEPAVQVFEQQGFKDLNAHDLGTYIPSTTVDKRLPLDRILVPDSQIEFSDSKLYGLNSSDSKDFRSQVSDHLMILTSVKILEDDD